MQVKENIADGLENEHNSKKEQLKELSSAIPYLSELYMVPEDHIMKLWEEEKPITVKRLKENGGIIEGIEMLQNKFGNKNSFHCLQMQALINSLENEANIAKEDITTILDSPTN